MAGSKQQRVDCLLSLYENALIKSHKDIHTSHINRLINDFECKYLYEMDILCGAIFYFYPDIESVVIVEVFCSSNNKMMYLSNIIGIVRNRKKIIFKVKKGNNRMLKFCLKIKCSMQYADDGWVYCVIER